MTSARARSSDPPPHSRVRRGSRRVQLRKWPADPSIGHLVVLDHHLSLDAADVAAVVAEARSRGHRSIRTSALFPAAASVVGAAGFVTVDTLALLEADLTDDRVERFVAAAGDAGVAVRRLWRHHYRAAADVDRSAFGDGWHNDARTLGEICRATPRHRARRVGARGGVTGFAITGAAGSNGYLQRLAVDPSAQRQGIGAALVADALLWMQRQGFRTAIVNTGIDNDAALALYHRAGFVQLPERLTVAEHRFAANDSDDDTVAARP